MTSINYISPKFTSTLGEIARVSSINNVFVVALSLLWVISLIIHSQKDRPVGLTHVMISALAHFICPIHAGGGLAKSQVEASPVALEDGFIVDLIEVCGSGV